VYANIKIITAKELCGSKAYVVVPGIKEGPLSKCKRGQRLGPKAIYNERLMDPDGSRIWIRSHHVRCKSDYSASLPKSELDFARTWPKTMLLLAIYVSKMSRMYAI